MRRRQRLLTPRAFGFAACALAMYAAGLVTGVAELFMLAMAGLALPVGAWLVVRAGRRRVAVTRSVRPLRIAQGGSIAVDLAVENLGRLETGVLLVSDRVPYQLGPAARFVLPGVPGGARERLSYRLEAANRGRFEIGPVSVRLSDPFDLAQTTSELAGTTPVIVHPRVEQLPAPALGGDLAVAPIARLRRLDASGEEFYTTREYRDGDDLRKVHWRSSAKRGELMVRQDESPRHARALVAIDLRRAAHRGADEHGSFERTVSVAASVAVRLAASSFELACVLDDGRQIRPPSRVDGAVPILDFLATVSPTSTGSLAPLATRLAHGSGEGLLIALLAAPSPEEAAALARCRSGYAAALALVVSVDDWGGARDAGAARERATSAAVLLQRAGWRVATLEHSGRLEVAWRQLTAPRHRVEQVGASGG